MNGEDVPEFIWNNILIDGRDVAHRMRKKTNHPKHLRYNRAIFSAGIITTIWQLVSRYKRKVSAVLYLPIANRKRFINVRRVSGERFNNKYKPDPTKKKKREIRNLYAGRQRSNRFKVKKPTLIYLGAKYCAAHKHWHNNIHTHTHASVLYINCKGGKTKRKLKRYIFAWGVSRGSFR